VSKAHRLKSGLGELLDRAGKSLAIISITGHVWHPKRQASGWRGAPSEPEERKPAAAA